MVGILYKFKAVLALWESEWQIPVRESQGRAETEPKPKTNKRHLVKAARAQSRKDRKK